MPCFVRQCRSSVLEDEDRGWRRCGEVRSSIVLRLRFSWWLLLYRSHTRPCARVFGAHAGMPSPLPRLMLTYNIELPALLFLPYRAGTGAAPCYSFSSSLHLAVPLM